MRNLSEGNDNLNRTELAVLIKAEMIAIKKAAVENKEKAINDAFTCYAIHNFKVSFYEDTYETYREEDIVSYVKLNLTMIKFTRASQVAPQKVHVKLP